MPTMYFGQILNSQALKLTVKTDHHQLRGKKDVSGKCVKGFHKEEEKSNPATSLPSTGGHNSTPGATLPMSTRARWRGWMGWAASASSAGKEPWSCRGCSPSLQGLRFRSLLSSLDTFLLTLKMSMETHQSDRH